SSVDANAEISSQKRVSGGIRRIYAAAKFSAMHPNAVHQAVALVRRSRQQTANDARAVLTNWLCKCSVMRRMAAGGIFVSDEGVLHAVWSMAYRSSERAEIPVVAAELVMGMLPTSWVVVEVDNAGESIVQRLGMRAGRPNRLAQDIRRSPRALEHALAAMG